MTLTIHSDVEQGTPEWHDVRRGIMTASVVGQFITPKTVKVAANDKTRAMAYQLVAERITGWTEDTYVSREMEIGHIVEPIARDLYSQKYAPAAEVGFMVREEEAFRLGYSPDGTVGQVGLIEIKRHLPKLHLAAILRDEVPSEHIAQCQTGLFVSGREWIDYISWCGGLPMWVKRVFPDPLWFAAIEEACAAFEKSAKQMISDYEVAVRGLAETERVDYLAEIEITI